MEKLPTEYCLHRNLIQLGGLFGCPDCGAGDADIKADAKIKPRRPDPVIAKVNEIVACLNARG